MAVGVSHLSPDQRRYPSPVIAELMALPLEFDRTVLRKAVNLMQEKVTALTFYPYIRWEGKLNICCSEVK